MFSKGTRIVNRDEGDTSPSSCSLGQAIARRSMLHAPSEVSDPLLITFPSLQTQRVYAWEELVFTDCYLSYLSLTECKQIVDDLWESFKLNVDAPIIYDGRGAPHARAVGSECLHLPQWARNHTVVAHELAHSLTDLISSDDSRDHGGIYMHIYLTLLATVTNHKYDVMHNSASAHAIRIQKIYIHHQLKPFKR